MRGVVCAAVLAALVCAVVAAGPVLKRPRGVSKADEAAYSQRDGKFACFDKSKAIPFERVNDDYCDCADGSDEPGTSACSPKGRFWCVNRGHEGHFIPSSRVGDGICDCCDGSDEWKSGSCPNACLEKGAESRRKAADAAKVFAQGAEIKARWSEEGRTAVAEAEEKMNDLRLKLESQKGIVATIEAKKKEAEELQNKEREAQRQIDEEKRKAEEERRKAEAPPPPPEGAEPPPPPAEGEAPAPTEEPPLPEVKNLDQYPTQHDEAADKLKAEFDEASDEKRRMEEDMAKLEKIANTDFGPEKEFFGLNNQCFNLKVPEYTYEICPFDKATQKIGYSDTVNLGKWSKWSNGYRRMEFREGQQCWNGPKREADVDLVCGAKNELKSVSEPNKCVYLFVLETPAACSLAEAEALLAAAAVPAMGEHDEL